MNAKTNATAPRGSSA